MAESKERTRSSFEDVAKLANLSEQSTGVADSEEENSGMINLTAIAAGHHAQKTLSGSPGPPERGQRLMDPLDAGAPSSSPMSTPAPSSSQLAAPPPPRPPLSIDPVSGMTARFPSASLLMQQMDAASPAPAAWGPAPRAAAPSPPRSLEEDGAAWRGQTAAMPVPSPGRPPQPAIAMPTSAPRRSPLPVATHLSPTAPPLALETAKVAPRAPEFVRGAGPIVWLALLGGIGLGGLAAGAFFQMRSSENGRAVRLLAAPAATAVSAAKAVSSESPAAFPAPGAAHVVEAIVVPPPPPHPVEAVAPRSPPIAGHGAAPAAAAPVTVAASPAPISTSTTVATDPTPSPIPSASAANPPASDTAEQSLEALMRKAVGTSRAAPPAAPAAPPAAEATKPPAGNLPQKPSMGAVQGALGAVLPATRYCLGPDDPISHATLTFVSDGTVQSVGVTGDAAGQPAEACIRSRLMNARVPAFSSPTFTWTVTVRPAS